ncbi:MAG: tetratricopeptide repeat protein [Chromatiales bacterium]|nr:tetratricopeptide repeat protein [Chromatiales bacterium]
MPYWVTKQGRVAVTPASAARWGEADVCVRHGLLAREAGQLADAEVAFREACGADPLNVQALHGLALVQRDNGRIDEAARLLAAAHALQPEDGPITVDLGLLREAQGRIHQALKLYEAAATKFGVADAADINRANALARMNRVDASVAVYKAVLSRAPERQEVLTNLTLLLERVGRLRSASEAVREGLKHSTRNPTLHLVAARLERRGHQPAKAVDRLQRRLKESHPPHLEGAMQAELGRSFDACDKADEAMAAFGRASQLQASDPRTSSRKVIGVFELLDNAHWHPQAPSDSVGAPSDVAEVTFVIAPPGAGCSDLAALVRENTDGRVLEDPGPMAAVQAALVNAPVLEAGDVDRIARLRAEYMAFAAEQSGRRDGPIMDIGSANLMRIDVLSRLFPTARVGLLIRHPIDLVMACISRYFQPSAVTAHFSTLANTVEFVRHAESVMHRLAVDLGQHAHLMRYEALVEEPDRIVKRLIEFAGLPATTARRRKPRFDEGLAPGRWTHYWPWLKEHGDALQQLCKASGYGFDLDQP